MRIAVLHLGTSVSRLLVAEARADGTFTSVLRTRALISVGDAVARTGRVGEALQARVTETVRDFATQAHRADSVKLVACATGAIREAEDGGELIDSIFSETGVRIRVLGSRDEARLTFTAVRGSVAIGPTPAVCFNLGQRNLSVMVGDGDGLLWSISLPLGVARVADGMPARSRFGPELARQLERRVAEALGRVVRDVSDFQPGVAVAAGSTARALARLATAGPRRAAGSSEGQKTSDEDPVVALTRTELTRFQRPVIDLTSWGESGGDADPVGGESPGPSLLAIGATVFASALELLGFGRLVVSPWDLAEGLILDTIARQEPWDWSLDVEKIRQSAVLSLARRCNWDEAHGRHVSGLAVDLFDQTFSVHRLGGRDRELLEHAALLHDIGRHVSAESHHKHTAYLVQHGRLRGFEPGDVEALAAVARYHRRSEPSPEHEPFALLDPARQERVTRLAAVLRIADGLDCGHAGAVEGIEVDLTGQVVRLTVHAVGDAELELWGARRKRGLFERVFGRRLELVASGHSREFALAPPVG